MTDTIKIKAFYDRDTHKTHRYLIEESSGIKGTIYIDKDCEQAPKQIVIEMKIKGQ